MPPGRGQRAGCPDKTSPARGCRLEPERAVAAVQLLVGGAGDQDVVLRGEQLIDQGGDAVDAAGCRDQRPQGDDPQPR